MKACRVFSFMSFSGDHKGVIQLLRSHKMTKFGPTPLFPPCLHLVDFGNPPSCERSKLYLIPPPAPPPIPNS